MPHYTDFNGFFAELPAASGEFWGYLYTNADLVNASTTIQWTTHEANSTPELTTQLPNQSFWQNHQLAQPDVLAVMADPSFSNSGNTKRLAPSGCVSLSLPQAPGFGISQRTRFRDRASILVVLVVAALGAWSCGNGDSPKQGVDGASTPVDRGRLGSVAWVTIDSASAPLMSVYGGPYENTPRIHALAHEALVFERAYSQWPSTLGSTASFLTGLYPQPDRSPGSVQDPTIAVMLKEAGFHTAAFSENTWISPTFGFDAGFETFVMIDPVRAETHPFWDLARRDTASTIDRALAWLDTHSDQRFFLYLHLLPPHAP